MLLDSQYYTYQDSAGFQSPPASPYYSPAPSPFSENYFTFPIATGEHCQWTYQGYVAQSPLLSATATDIPETVRYEGYGHEAFGHDIGYGQSGGVYNTNSNFQVGLATSHGPR